MGRPEHRLRRGNIFRGEFFVHCLQAAGAQFLLNFDDIARLGENTPAHQHVSGGHQRRKVTASPLYCGFGACTADDNINDVFNGVVAVRQAHPTRAQAHSTMTTMTRWCAARSRFKSRYHIVLLLVG